MRMSGQLSKWLRRSCGAGLAAVSLVVVMLAANCGPPPAEPTTKTDAEPKVAAADTKPEPEQPVGPDIDLEGLPGRVHIVQAGDTLYSLAEKYYGHGRHYQKILMANRKRLTDPNDLPVGMKLIIP